MLEKGLVLVLIDEGGNLSATRVEARRARRMGIRFGRYYLSVPVRVRYHEPPIHPESWRWGPASLASQPASCRRVSEVSPLENEGEEAPGVADRSDQGAHSTLNHVGGRDHHPRELRVSEPHVEYKSAQVLKPLRRPILQSGFRSTNAAYPLLHIDTLNNALSSSARRDDVDPVLHVQGYSSDGKQSACCHVKCGDVRILAPISGDGT